ncbi:MAG: AMP-binding protein [Arachnia sp.]
MTLPLTFPTRRARSPLPPPGDVDPASPALCMPNGTVIDHGTLRERVDGVAAGLPAGGLLAHVRLTPTIDDIVAYLAVLEAGHVPLLMPLGDAARAMEHAWPADLSVVAGEITMHADGEQVAPGRLLHPELAMLLSTSGSTGSPKLVRLSRSNVISNASAIASALGITASDRGVTSLPLHYCFGLSVLHSHLIAGASVALTGDSVLNDAFWDVVDDGVTNVAVVPHMVDLMEGTGVLERPHPSLRLIAQAGGRMAPERVERIARLGRDRGWGLAVMYGQSEATARISVQPPDLTVASPDTVGHLVPGTSIRLDTGVAEADATTGSGEIIVSGPGVMLGYAEHADDLALGRMVTELRTGDMGVLDDDGVLRIVGRRAGFVKVLGLRIDLSRVEAALEHEGLTACVTGDDTGLRAAVEPCEGEQVAETAARARRVAARACGLGVGHVRAAVLPLARLANGKVDRAGCDVLVRVCDPEECADARQRIDAPGPSVRAAAVLRDVLGCKDVDLNQSFVAQGGDSLSHVSASVGLAGVLGALPRDWHHRTLADLIESAPAAGEVGSDGHVRRGAWLRVETSVLLRALAAVMIIGTHAGLFRLPGGAHSLMVVAGFNAALFGLSAAGISQRWRGTARFLIGVAVPTMVVAAVGMALGRYGWGNVMLANWATGEWGRLQRNELWFVDALILCVLFVTAALSCRPLAQRWRTNPWRVAFGLAIVALVPRYVILEVFEGTLRGLMPTVFWLFAVGLALAHAHTWPRRASTLAVAVVGVINFYPDDPPRNATILVGIVLLALLQNVRIPAFVVPLISLLAAASLHIYLVQFLILDQFASPLLGTLVALAAGVLLWRAMSGPVHRIQQLVPTGSGFTLYPSNPTNAPERTIS